MGTGYNFKYGGKKGVTERVIFNKNLKQMMKWSERNGKERVPVKGNSKCKGTEAETCVLGMFKEQQERQKHLEEMKQKGLIINNITGMLYTKQMGN